MNRNKFVHIRILLSSLCVLCVLCVSISAQEWKSVADGVEYAEVRREFSGKPVNINLLRLDLKKVRLDVHHAMDAAIGTEKTSSIATRHKAFAAINAGFFRLDKSPFAGDPVGVFLVDGKPISESVNNRIALLLYNGSRLTTTAFEHLSTNIFLEARQGRKTGGWLGIQGINREPKLNETILYTPTFGKTPPSANPITELIASECLKTCRKFSFVETKGATTIPPDGFVVSFTLFPGRAVASAFESIVSKSKHLANPTINIVSADGERRINTIAKDIVTGVPQLIKNSKIDITWEQEKSSKAFVETRHPRTAVAKLKDGKFLMLTADGRSEQSAGLDLYDLAAYFLQLGATDAMNLDGGGSTAMFLDGRVVNKPSDKEGERKVGDAILVTLRKKK